MKKTLSYPELWKQKQRELPVKGKPDEQWLRMRAMLDQRLPVSNVIKKPPRFKLPKWGLKLLVGVSVGAAVYMGVRLYLSKTYHDAAKPNELQIHRDSLLLPGKGLAPAANTAAPVTQATAPSSIRQIKPTSESGLKRQGSPIDSISTPAQLNIPVRRDRALTPMEAPPLKPLRDSIGPAELKTKDMRKDTSTNNGKAQKKKRRPKVSVFF
jgi:hypothetical protein